MYDLNRENKYAIHETSQWFERMHAVVIGPGLGRDPVVCLDTVKVYYRT